MIRLAIRIAPVALALAAAGGCTTVAPNYNPSVDNIQKLRDSGAAPARVGTFEPKLVSGQRDDYIQLRASNMESPYGGKFTTYIEQALKADLAAAQLLDEKSNVVIGGVVTKNDVSVGSMSEGTGEIEARVTVKRGGETRYDKVKSAKVTFESSFAGAVAIPAGRRAYPGLVQNFIAALFADPEFIAALK
ncbi:MAG TPA: hypothetical protein VJO54_08455 [Burkholderiales bacterium]|nr:hypothetical protein [Burkholderiales bacterium]